jgi:type III secretion protein T
MLTGSDPTSMIREIIPAVALATARAGGMLALTPFLGRGIVTGMARSGITLAIALPMVPALVAQRPPEILPTDLWLIAGLLVKEVILGVLLGLPLAIAVWGLEAAGFVVDNQRGSTMASSLNPASGEQSSPLGILLAQVMVTWLFVSGAFVGLLGLLYASFGVWGAWTFLPDFSPRMAQDVLAVLDAVMRTAITFAGPAMAAMFIAEMGLALVSRFAPQLQVFFLAMPVKSGVGLFVLMLGLTFSLPEAAKLIPSTEEVLRRIGTWFR